MAFRVLKALYGKNPLRFYLLRVSGFLHASRHIGGNVVRLQRYLMATYRAREDMPAPVKRGMSRWQFGHLKGALSVLSPFYDPARKEAPVALDQVLTSV